jgi:hypothetical protein
MKQNSKRRNICAFAVAFILVLGFSRCGYIRKNCCGYNGPITSPDAIALYAKEHFIAKDLIDEWTARYEAKTGLSSIDSLKKSDLVLHNSYSFNGYYVCLLLCNKKSIGLRILRGMDEKNQVHIILVGINPDYTTLYIRKPGPTFITSRLKKFTNGVNSLEEEMQMPGDHVVGGLQFSQKP